MLMRIVLGLVTILLVFEYSNACTCAGVPRETIYNASDFVSHVKILNKMEAADLHSIVYDIKHLGVFKPMGENLPSQLFTSQSESTCGVVNLIKNSDYVLSGYFRENGTSLSIDICGHIRRVENGLLYLDLAKNETVKIEDDPILHQLLEL